MSHHMHDHVPDKNALVGIDPAELARVRASVKTHIEKTGSLEGLDIERYKPPAGLRFAFVHATPKIQSHGQVVDHSLRRRCSYCETDRRFVDGFIVLCSDGKLRLIGPECWKDHIGEQDWRTERSAFSRYQRNERFRVAQERYFPVARSLQAEIRDVRSQFRAALVFADQFSMKLQETFPSLSAELEKARNHSGQLFVERLVTSYESLEGAKGQAAADRLDDRVSRHNVLIPIHRLSGIAAIDPRPNVVTRAFDRAFKRINDATLLAQGNWEAMNDAQFDKTATDFGTACADSVDAAREAIDAMRSITAFLSATNIGGIVKWTEDSDCELWLTEHDGRYEAVSGGLAFVARNGPKTELRLPSYYQVPGLAHLAEMAELLMKNGIGTRKAA